MFRKRTVGILLALIALVAIAPSPSFAAAGDFNFEAFGGYYIPGVDGLDNDMVFGARFGGRPTDKFGWQVSTGLFDANGEEDRPLAGTVGDADVWLVDFSFQWFPGGGNFVVFAGPGFASANVDLVGTQTDASDDVFSMHAGVAYIWNVTEKFYIRPDVRWRDINGDVYNSTDSEMTLGFGWKF